MSTLLKVGSYTFRGRSAVMTVFEYVPNILPFGFDAAFEVDVERLAAYSGVVFADFFGGEAGAVAIGRQLCQHDCRKDDRRVHHFEVEKVCLI